jgi:hypothetical protein
VNDDLAGAAKRQRLLREFGAGTVMLVYRYCRNEHRVPICVAEPHHFHKATDPAPAPSSTPFLNHI